MAPGQIVGVYIRHKRGVNCLYKNDNKISWLMRYVIVFFISFLRL